MFKALILFLLVFRQSVTALDLPSKLSVPDTNKQTMAKEIETHQLSKRQSSCLYFFLDEPPQSLQCNPQPNRILTLRCKFLVGSITRRLPLNIGWFFSADRIVGELVQVSPFEARASFTAFENVLVVSKSFCIKLSDLLATCSYL